MPNQAQRKRAEARENRRDHDSDASPENDGGSSEDQTLDAVKQAAKVAAASVAAGAVAAAVRALANRHESAEEQGSEEQDSENRERPDPEPEASAAAEPEEQEPEPDRAPEQEAEQEPEAKQEPEQAPEQARPREQAQTSVRPEPIEGATPDEAREVVDGAKRQLELLLGKTPEMVSSLERTDDGWLVTVEVVEVSRIPESTDVLASYEIELDDDHNLRRYARVRRYNRSQAEREGVS
jgi:hypothetical protein